jgi:hypothetical protein
MVKKDNCGSVGQPCCPGAYLHYAYHPCVSSRDSAAVSWNSRCVQERRLRGLKRADLLNCVILATFTRVTSLPNMPQHER